MSAYLDTHKMGPDYRGGVSDPRLHQLIESAYPDPIVPKDPEKVARVDSHLRRRVEAGTITLQDAITIHDMLYGPVGSENPEGDYDPAALNPFTADPHYEPRGGRDCE